MTLLVLNNWAQDTLIPHYICCKLRTNLFFYILMSVKITGWLTNNADPDQMLHSVASDLGLHCLLRPVYQNT